MADLAKYEVLRRLDGDRLYEPGETREMAPADAKPLVDLGSLRPIRSAAKAEAEHANKAEPAPANKAEAVVATKRTARKSRR